METVTLPISLRDLSDNLRNPLTGILGMVYLLKTTCALTAEQIEYIEGIEHEGELLKILADKLLQAKSVDMNTKPMEPHVH